MDTQSFRAMGSRINVIWDSATPPPDGWQSLPALFEQWEQCLSRFRPDSELSRLNAQAGQPVGVSETLLEVLTVAHGAVALSDGWVLPTLLPQLEATGYTQDFKQMIASGDAIATKNPPVVVQEEIIIERDTQTVTVPFGTRVDVGGIAKGWAADKLATQWGTQGAVLIEVGGDIAVWGPRADGSPWAIGVTHPLHPDGSDPLALVLLNTGGIATSGRDYRRWQVGDRAFHHIIDPRTGKPAETDVLTATVIAPTTIEAEIAAKAMLIQGSEAGLAWLEQRPELAGLVVRADGEVRISERWKLYDWAYLYSGATS